MSDTWIKTKPTVLAWLVGPLHPRARKHRGFDAIRCAHLMSSGPPVDIVELADRYDTPIRTALRLDIAPEDAILRQARLGRYDLVVMGVGRPAGETLYFGKIAAAVLDNSQHSVLFVSS